MSNEERHLLNSSSNAEWEMSYFFKLPRLSGICNSARSIVQFAIILTDKQCKRYKRKTSYTLVRKRGVAR